MYKYTSVVEIPKELLVLLGGGKVDFVIEMIGLVNLFEMEIISENEVDQGGLGDLVVMNTAVPVDLHKERAGLFHFVGQFLYSEIVEINVGVQIIKVTVI